MFIPEDIIEKVRESNDIVDVISEYVPLKRRGKNMVGLCPFHKEKTPSFSVLPEKQIYHCFGCGEGGNVISFIMKYKNIGFVDAVVMLAERAGIEIPEGGGSFDSPKAELKKSIYDLNREAARFFYSNLKSGNRAAEYFKRRGIDERTAKKFGLGYADDSSDYLLNYFRRKGYSAEILAEAGLVIKKENSGVFYDRFRNRVMFPVFDVRNRVIGFGGRVLDDSKPKYLNSPETLVFNKRKNLYGLNFAIKGDTNRKILIVEGYMDVIALHQFGIVNAVASLGTALTNEQAKLIKRYADDVIIGYDADTAGQAATLRGLDILAGTGLNVTILNIPSGKDPDEFIRARGRDAFVKSMDDAIPLIEYKIKRRSEGYDLSSTEGKIGFIRACSSILSGVNDPVVVDAYVTKLSNESGISAQALYDEISKLRNAVRDDDRNNDTGIRYNNNDDGQKLYLEPAYLKAMRVILGILSEKKELLSSVEKRLLPDDFCDDVYRKSADIIYRKLRDDEPVVPASIIDLFEKPDEMKKVSDIFNNREIISEDSIQGVVDDCIINILKYKLSTKKETILSEIRKSEAEGNVQQTAILLKELAETERQMRNL